jgi:hypothetical protein
MPAGEVDDRRLCLLVERHDELPAVRADGEADRPVEAAARLGQGDRVLL